MLRCTPEATLKPKCSEFMQKTVITDVFVAQVYWEAVPKTWPGGSKASVAKCVVCPWNSTRSVGGRAESTSWTFRNQVYVVSQVRRCLAGQRRVNETCQPEVDALKVQHQPVAPLIIMGTEASLCTGGSFSSHPTDSVDALRDKVWWQNLHPVTHPTNSVNALNALNAVFNQNKTWTTNAVHVVERILLKKKQRCCNCQCFQISLYKKILDVQRSSSKHRES